MSGIVPLKKNYEFGQVYKRGRFFVSKFLVLYILRNNTGRNRIGITISKKVGKSVRRNRVKRLIRENFRMVEMDLKKGYDMVFVSRKTRELPSFKQITRDMNYLLKNLDMFKERVN